MNCRKNKKKRCFELILNERVHCLVNSEKKLKEAHLGSCKRVCDFFRFCNKSKMTNFD